MPLTDKAILLFDDSTWNDLLPLTFTRPAAALRIGILTLKEKWEHLLKHPVSFYPRPYLQKKYKPEPGNANLLVNGAVFPNEYLINEISKLQTGQALVDGETLVAIHTGSSLPDLPVELPRDFKTIPLAIGVEKLNYLWEIFQNNGRELHRDFYTLTRGRESAKISSTNQVINPANVFVEKGAIAEFAVINASGGPVYLAENAEIMEGSLVRGPFALGAHSVLKMGAKIYGPTTIGPGSKVGGEVNNSVIQGNSNKAHDGFLGNSVLGEWCNIGADSNNSNLKNNYAPVKLWSYRKEGFIPTGLQFCGLIMGDHSKCGINTMFNTGTVVGVSANIFGEGFPRNFIPDFAWGGHSGFSLYPLAKALETARLVMERRGVELDETEQTLLETVFEMSTIYRNF